jgi:multisubunit Na+/H+ antiporter MnhE subunit
MFTIGTVGSVCSLLLLQAVANRPARTKKYHFLITIMSYFSDETMKSDAKLQEIGLNPMSDAFPVVSNFSFDNKTDMKEKAQNMIFEEI